MQFNRTALCVLAATTALAVPATAQAAVVKHHHRPAIARLVTQKYMEPGLRYNAGDYQGPCMNGTNPVAWLRAHGSNVMRLILQPNNIADGVACVRDAQAAGFRIYLSLWYPNTDSPRTVAEYVTNVAATYGPTWAVSIGNEESLAGPDGSATDYNAVWRTAEPVLAHVEPHAIRVFADASPWDASWVRSAIAPGASVIAAHCYDTAIGGLGGVPALAKWAAGRGLPLWCSEMDAQTQANGPYGGMGFFQTDTATAYRTKLDMVEMVSANLEMTSSYYWPQIGAS